MSDVPVKLDQRNPFLEERRIPRTGRVFVNRNLRLPSIGAIGFDLDHTLAHYAPVPVEQLAFDVTRRKLIEKKGYPEEMMASDYDPRFVIRGLVIDKKRGNIVKMNYHSYVARAYHGRREIHSDERKKQYQQRPIHLSNAMYASVDTLFHLPEVYLYLILVEIMEGRGSGRRLNYARIYADVREMIDEAHRDGTIKTVIESDPGRYVRPDPNLSHTLEDFRRSGKKLFLLTNSEYHYTNVLLSYVLKDRLMGRSSWREFFDVIVVDSGKPGFFLNRGREEPPQLLPDESSTPIYSGGDADFLEEKLGFHADRILYFGDHTYGDILRSKKSVGWRTAMIIEELERELDALQRIRPALEKLSMLAALRERLEADKLVLERESRKLRLIVENLGGSDPKVLAKVNGKLGRLDDELKRLDAELKEAVLESRTLRREADQVFNSNWGSIFREGNETSRFGHQVEDFACLYTSRVSNFINYPPTQYFQAPVRLLPHEL
jgi:5'-nucleotidase